MDDDVLEMYGLYDFLDDYCGALLVIMLVLHNNNNNRMSN